MYHLFGHHLFGAGGGQHDGLRLGAHAPPPAADFAARQAARGWLGDLYRATNRSDEAQKLSADP